MYLIKRVEMHSLFFLNHQFLFFVVLPPTVNSMAQPNRITKRTTMASSSPKSFSETPRPAKKRRMREVVQLPGGFLENLLERAETNYPEVHLVIQNGRFGEWRCMVCEWIAEVCYDRCYPGDVYVRSMIFLDMYTARVVAERTTFQCVAAACIWIALKYESLDMGSWEGCSADLVDASGGAFSVKDICRAEWRVLQGLNWKLDIVLPHTFVRFMLSDHWDPLCDRAIFEFPRTCAISLALGIILAIERDQNVRISHPFIDVMMPRADASTAHRVRTRLMEICSTGGSRLIEICSSSLSSCR